MMKDIGGKKWWTVRGRSLSGEFVEMAKDQLAREQAEEEARAEGREPEASRVLLYIHGALSLQLAQVFLAYGWRTGGA